MRAAIVCVACLLFAAASVPGSALLANNRRGVGGSVSDDRDDAQPGSPVVGTTCGLVSGVAQGDIQSFLGIPFAAPPVGDLRWKPPMGLKEAQGCWSGTFAAHEFGNGCMQQGAGATPYGDEDCLFLNVWRPASATADSKLPVMVFIYGGGLTAGDTRWYPQDELARTGKMIGVSINYRLNGFGFMALQDLSDMDPRGVSGNYGFLDQQLGLQWVQDNIAAFGGDPTRVTVWGQSSGGTSVLALMASPASNGLFSRALSLSGSPNITADLATAQQQNQPFVTQLGCASSSNVSACLLSKTAVEVFAALPADVWGGDAEPGQSGLPSAVTGEHYPAYAVVDGVTVVAPVQQALERGVVDVPFMVGSMAQELDLGPDVVVFNYTQSEWSAFLKKRFAPWGDTFGSMVNEKYAAEAKVNPQKAYDSIGTDTGVTCGNIALAIAAGKGLSSPVFSYVNSYVPSHPWPYDATGYACHYSFHELDMMSGLNGWSWFHDYADPPKPPVFVPEAADLAYGAVMRDVWYTFTNTGSVESLGWRRVNDVVDFPHNYVTADLRSNITSVISFRGAMCDWWRAQGFGPGFWWTN